MRHCAVPPPYQKEAPQAAHEELVPQHEHMSCHQLPYTDPAAALKPPEQQVEMAT